MFTLHHENDDKTEELCLDTGLYVINDALGEHHINTIAFVIPLMI